MTFKKKIEVLKAMRDNTLYIANYYEKHGELEKHEKMFSEYMGIDKCISILENNKFAEEIASIYEVEV